MSIRMTRLLLAVFLSVAVALVGVTATGAQTEQPISATAAPAQATPPTPPVCATPKQYKRKANDALRVSATNGNFVATVDKKALRQADDMRACAKLHFPHRYKLMGRMWDKRKRTYRFYAYIDKITPYGAWAIPPVIVNCESHFSWKVANKSGAVGPYQLLGWGAPWPVNSVRDMAQHHILAHRLGLSHWNASRSCWG